jgi:hypothetical protein
LLGLWLALLARLLAVIGQDYFLQQETNVYSRGVFEHRFASGF